MLQQIKVMILTIFAVIRRAFCCFSRRRRASFSEPVEILNNIVVECNSTNAGNNKRHQHVERDWNSWDDSPRTVEEHIEQYRQRVAETPTQHKNEPDIDFFKELTPVIKPQLKYYLNDKTKEKTDFSRLEAKTDVPIAINADLEDWQENDQGGWEELDSEKTKQLIRDKRREIRNERQKAHRPAAQTFGTAQKQNIT